MHLHPLGSKSKGRIRDDRIRTDIHLRDAATLLLGSRAPALDRLAVDLGGDDAQADGHGKGNSNDESAANRSPYHCACTLASGRGADASGCGG